jgi:hypothetical protein
MRVTDVETTVISRVGEILGEEMDRENACDWPLALRVGIAKYDHYLAD